MATASDLMSVQFRLREVLREAIDEAGLTQRAVAARLGVTEQHISRLLTGRVQLTLFWAEQIARACGCQLSVELTTSAASDS